MLSSRSACDELTGDFGGAFEAIDRRLPLTAEAAKATGLPLAGKA
jgi:hypothetical protein